MPTPRKPGARPKPRSLVRRERVVILLTRDELTALNARCAAAGLERSEYIRALIRDAARAAIDLADAEGGK